LASDESRYNIYTDLWTEMTLQLEASTVHVVFMYRYRYKQEAPLSQKNHATPTAQCRLGRQYSIRFKDRKEERCGLQLYL